MKTLYKYIFNEIWPTFLTSLLVFIFIVLAARMVTISEWVINQGVSPLMVIQMILFLLPNIILFALPAASLMAVFIAFLRLSGDNEILALKVSGISLYKMMPPVLLASLIAGLMAMFIGVYGAPWGNRTFKDLIVKIAQTNASLGIKERVFSEPFTNITFYVNSFSSKEGSMKDVFLVDRRDPLNTNTIIAREGRVLLHPKSRTITIHFTGGTIFMVGKKFEAVRTTEFETYDLNIGLDDIMSNLSSRKKAPKEMSIKELANNLKTTPKGEMKYNEMIIELHGEIFHSFGRLFDGAHRHAFGSTNKDQKPISRHCHQSCYFSYLLFESGRGKEYRGNRGHLTSIRLMATGRLFTHIVLLPHKSGGE